MEILLRLGNGIVVGPGLRDSRHHRQRQIHAVHHQEFQGVVQHGRVRAAAVHHRKNFGKLSRKIGRGHILLPGQHLIHISLDGIDLAVVDNQAVGVGTLPAGLRVGAEAGVNHGDGRGIVPALQICIEGPQLAHQEHALVDDGPAGQGHHIGARAALLEFPAHHIEAAVKGKAAFRILRPRHKGLLDIRHTGSRPAAKHLRAYRHLPPAQEGEALALYDGLKHLPGLVLFQLVLGEEEHADAVFPLAANIDSFLLAGFLKKAVGNLQQDPHAVSGLALRVLSGPVLQVLHDLQSLAHHLMALPSVQIHHSPDAAVVVLQRGAVQSLISFHNLPPHFFVPRESAFCRPVFSRGSSLSGSFTSGSSVSSFFISCSFTSSSSVSGRDSGCQSRPCKAPAPLPSPEAPLSADSPESPRR